MKKSLILFIALVISAATYGQLNLTFTDGTVAPGGNVEVDVTATGFDNLLITQYSVNWDPSKLRFVEIKNISTELPDFNAGSFATPADLEPGQMTVSWSQPQTGITVANGTRLYTIVLEGLSGGCDSTADIEVTNEPLRIEIIDGSFNEINLASTVGMIEIDCGGMGGDDIGLIASTETVNPGEEVCVQFSVKKFNDIQIVQSGITWDPAVLQFDRLQGFNGLTSLSAGDFNAGNVDMGQLRLLWTDPTAENPVTLDDNTVIFEICFTAIGGAGDMTDIELGNIGNFQVLFVNSSEEELPFDMEDGKVTINDDGTDDTFTLEMDRVTASEGSTVCLNVVTRNFDDIISMQFNLTWDESVLDFKEISSINLDGLNAGSFNQLENNVIRMMWSSFNGSGFDVADNTSLFQICFDVVGDCNAEPSSAIDYIEFDGIGIEIVRGATLMAIDPVRLISGQVDVAPCGVNYEVTDRVDPDCPGEAGGSISVRVSGGDDDCDCEWLDSDGNVVSSGTIGGGNCSLLGQEAGTYTFRITCAGMGEIFSTTETINGADAIEISGAVTSAACGAAGEIALTVNGGNGGFSYAWTPDQGNTDNPTGLSVGMYSVVVTDSEGCMATEEFTINDDVTGISIDETDVQNATCFGDTDGSIMLTISGGCTDSEGGYDIAWTDSDGNALDGDELIMNLTGGDYTVVITDASDPALTFTRTITVGSSSEIVITVASVTNATNGSNGEIDIDVEGGDGTYSYAWTPDQGNTDNPTGLAEGTYTVVVTDGSGCTATRSDITVGGSDNVSFSDVAGTETACAEECEGMISGRVTAAIFPVTVAISGTGTGSTTLSEAGDFSFSDLCPGEYTLTFTNGSGVDTDGGQVTVGEPDKLTIMVSSDEITCDMDGGNTGAINPIVTGGTGSYDYEWSTGETSSSISDLSVGTYSLLVTDGNGCEALASGIRVNDCDDPTGNCYDGITVITPNGDNINDFLTIPCAGDVPSNLGVYSRSGIRIYSEENYLGGWNGLDSSGNEVPEGAYMWVLEVNRDNAPRELYRGTVTVLREF